MVLFPYKSVFFPRSGHGGEPTHHPAPSLESNPTDATEEKGCWETGEQRRGAWVPKCRDRLGPGSMRATREAQFQGRVFQHHVCRYYCPDQQKHPLEGLLWYLDSAWLGRVSNKSKCNGASPLLTLCLPTSPRPQPGSIRKDSGQVLGMKKKKDREWRDPDCPSVLSASSPTESAHLDRTSKCPSFCHSSPRQRTGRAAKHHQVFSGKKNQKLEKHVCYKGGWGWGEEWNNSHWKK